MSGQRSPQAEAARERSRLLLPSTLMAFVGLLALTMPLPQRFVAALPLGLSLALSIRALIKLKDRPRNEKVMPVIGLGLVAVFLGTLVLQGAFYSTVKRYEDCLDQAQTQAARGVCEDLRKSGPLGGNISFN